MKLSSACVWKKRGYPWKKEAWSCLCSSDIGRGRVTATLVALGRAVPVLQMAESQGILLKSRMKTNAPLIALPHFLVIAPTVAPKCGNEVESRTQKSQTYRKPPWLWNVGGSKIKLSLLCSERNELSRNDCSSDTFRRLNPWKTHYVLLFGNVVLGLSSLHKWGPRVLSACVILRADNGEGKPGWKKYTPKSHPNIEPECR